MDFLTIFKVQLKMFFIKIPMRCTTGSITSPLFFFLFFTSLFIFKCYFCEIRDIHFYVNNTGSGTIPAFNETFTWLTYRFRT